MQHRDNLINGAKLGRIATHTPKAEARRAATMRRQEAGKQAWKLSDLPGWLTEKVCREKIQPRLATVTVPAIADAFGDLEALRGGYTRGPSDAASPAPGVTGKTREALDGALVEQFGTVSLFLTYFRTVRRYTFCFQNRVVLISERSEHVLCLVVLSVGGVRSPVIADLRS